MCRLELLPLGASSFEALRAKNRIYVDKTELIYPLALSDAKFFLSRPRRFGKTLLVSTFESLFAHGVRDFHGLWIESYWNDKTYPVARMDFSEIKRFKDADDFMSQFSDLIQYAFAPMGFVYDESKGKICLQLSNWLKYQPVSSLVILIDEYDAPLTACLSDLELFEKIQGELSKFYAQVKRHAGVFRFFFMTGITKFNKTGIFSELNDLIDISYAPMYGTLLGYTEEEIHQYFGEYMTHAAGVLGMPEQDAYAQLKAHYDGYCFDPRNYTHVYVPWSVLNFLSSPQAGFLNYWIDSGGQISLINEYFKTPELGAPELYQELKVVKRTALSASQSPQGIDDVALLTQAGYLTIRKAVGAVFYVGYPNREVAESMAQLYSARLLKNKILEQLGVDSGALSHIMAESPVENTIGQLNRMYLGIDYDNYPITSENTARSFVQVLMTGALLSPCVEVHNAHGRSDLEVDVGKRHWVFEFKFLPKETADQLAGAERLVEQAVQQIEKRQYGQTAGNDRELVRVGLVFSEKERQIVRWQVAK